MAQPCFQWREITWAEACEYARTRYVNPTATDPHIPSSVVEHFGHSVVVFTDGTVLAAVSGVVQGLAREPMFLVGTEALIQVVVACVGKANRNGDSFTVEALTAAADGVRTFYEPGTGKLVWRGPRSEIGELDK